MFLEFPSSLMKLQAIRIAQLLTINP